MFIDSSAFPFVWMRQRALTANTSTAPFDEFTQLLARQQAFVLLNDEGFNDGAHEHTQAERKQTALWMKRHKADLRSFVKGMVVIEPNATKRLAAKAFATLFGKFWGYPMFIVPSQGEALTLAQSLLRSHSAT